MYDGTQDRINRFAEATRDEQWIHLDRERARNELRGGKIIAHGLLSAARRISIAEAEEVPPDGLRVNYRVAIEVSGGPRPPVSPT